MKKFLYFSSLACFALAVPTISACCLLAVAAHTIFFSSRILAAATTTTRTRRTRRTRDCVLCGMEFFVLGIHYGQAVGGHEWDDSEAHIIKERKQTFIPGFHVYTDCFFSTLKLNSHTSGWPLHVTCNIQRFSERKKKSYPKIKA